MVIEIGVRTRAIIWNLANDSLDGRRGVRISERGITGVRFAIDDNFVNETVSFHDRSKGKSESSDGQELKHD